MTVNYQGLSGPIIHTASALHIEGAPPITSSCPGAQAAAPAVVLARFGYKKRMLTLVNIGVNKDWQRWERVERDDQ